MGDFALDEYSNAKVPSAPDHCLSNTCHTDATCTNTYDGYTCACNAGFTGDGTNCEQATTTSTTSTVAPSTTSTSTTSTVVPTTASSVYEYNADNAIACSHNTNVQPWVTYPGCNEPIDCAAKLEIVDSWKIGNGKKRPIRFGFVGKIIPPADYINQNKPFSVLIRFSSQITMGNFQMWNMKFWNFYNGGYEILIHSKEWNSDKTDPYSISFVAEGLNANEFPELLFWDQRQRRHHCFQPGMRSSRARSGAVVTPESNQMVMSKCEAYSFGNGIHKSPSKPLKGGKWRKNKRGYKYKVKETNF